MPLSWNLGEKGIDSQKQNQIENSNFILKLFSVSLSTQLEPESVKRKSESVQVILSYGSY